MIKQLILLTAFYISYKISVKFFLIWFITIALMTPINITLIFVSQKKEKKA